VLAGRWLPFVRRQRVPGFLSLLLKATEIGTMAAVRAAGRRADLLVRPEVARFSMTAVAAFDAIVAAGDAAARPAIAAWLAGRATLAAPDFRHETPATTDATTRAPPLEIHA
jgi:predicted acylesterase/phospholipase RssA